MLTRANWIDTYQPYLSVLAPVIVLIIGVVLSAPGFSAAKPGAESPAGEVTLAPGYSELRYTPAEAGSYRLPPLGRAGDGWVVDSSGKRLNLHRLLADKYVVLSFIYSSCNDVNGCPLSTFVLNQLQKKLARHPGLNRSVRLISLSFDALRDTPDRMRAYGAGFARPGSDWRFLTTASEDELQTVLEGYDQFVQRDIDPAGNPLDTISHLLKVFLIDRERRIRNIYSASFLHADTLLNDLLTLQQEGRDTPVSGTVAASTTRHGAGDNREGYESGDYRTRAQSLERRTGEPADLLRYLDTPPLGLPRLDLPAGSNPSRAQAELGKKLFFDRRLSHNNTISCANCHVPEQGFTSNELATAVGIEGRTVRRNAPTMYNVAYMTRLFHDARESTLEQQIWGPLLARNEMGNPSVGHIVDRIRGLEDYAGRFEQAFAGRGVGMETLGAALAAYQRLLVSADSAFDRWYFGKHSDAMPVAARRGFELFKGRGGCVACHTIDDGFALFTDQATHNTGIGYRYSMHGAPRTRRVAVAPGQFVEFDTAAVAEASEDKPNDLGEYEISGEPADRWKYRTPSLRNVALTAPYMHDGSLATLRDVVEFYNGGGVANELLDPLIKPLGLSDAEIEDVVSFLRSLTGSNVDIILADAFATPVGNVD